MWKLIADKKRMRRKLAKFQFLIRCSNCLTVRTKSVGTGDGNSGQIDTKKGNPHLASVMLAWRGVAEAVRRAHALQLAVGWPGPRQNSGGIENERFPKS
jgi:hypothetical protein